LKYFQFSAYVFWRKKSHALTTYYKNVDLFVYPMTNGYFMVLVIVSSLLVFIAVLYSFCSAWTSALILSSLLYGSWSYHQAGVQPFSGS